MSSRENRVLYSSNKPGARNRCVGFNSGQRFMEALERSSTGTWPPPKHSVDGKKSAKAMLSLLSRVLAKFGIRNKGLETPPYTPPRIPHTIIDIMNSGGITPEAAAYLWFLLDASPGLLVTGETGAGKTTMMNALVSLTDPRRHVTMIEYVRELSLPHFWAKHYWLDSEIFGQPFIANVINFVMRKQPRVMLIGEVRGEHDVVEAFNVPSFGIGMVSTFHATGIHAAIDRLKSEPLSVTDEHMANLWCVVHVSREKGKRFVDAVSEVYVENGTVKINVMFKHDEDGTTVPNNLQDVVQKSKRLEMAAAALYLREDDILPNLQKRCDILKKHAKAGMKNKNAVLGVMKDMYGIDYDAFKKSIQAGL